MSSIFMYMFGICLTLIMFFGAKYLKIPLINPLIFSILSIIGILYYSNISYDYFMSSAKYLDFLIGPATVALAIPLYKSYEVIKKNIKTILISLGITSFITCLSVLILSKLYGFSDILIISILPKTITTAIGIEISSQMGGIPAITIISIIITGNVGAIISTYIFKILNVDDKFIRGIALGTSAHAVGTAKALEFSYTEGAMSGVAMSITGIVVVFIAPLVYRIGDLWTYFF